MAHAVRLTKEILKENFKTGTPPTIGSSEMKIWKPWIQGIWQFIQNRYTDSFDKFRYVEIFPVYCDPEWSTVKDITLCSLSGILIHMPDFDDSVEMEAVLQAFKLLSVTVVKAIPDWIKYHIIGRYFHTMTEKSLMDIFTRIDSKAAVKNFNKKVDTEQQRALLAFLSRRLHTKVTAESANVLKRLNLFRQTRFDVEKECDEVSIQENSTIYTGDMSPIPLIKPMIMVSCEAEKIFGRNIGAKIVENRDMILSTLDDYGKYEEKDIQAFIFWVLRNPANVSDEGIMSLIRRKQIEFIETDGKFKRPSALFDPGDELLMQMFRNDCVLPNALDNNDAVIVHALRKLGLRTRNDVTCKDIERTCDIIENMPPENVLIATDNAAALLKFLNLHPKLINKEFLSNKTIVPVERLTLHNYPDNLELRNRSSPAKLCRPSDVTTSQDAHLIGSVRFISDCNAFETLASALGWLDDQKQEDVIQHFVSVVKKYDSKFKSSTIMMITKLYDWLAKNNKDTCMAVRTAIEEEFGSTEHTFIWNGEYFVSPTDVYIESSHGDLNMIPFVKNLPSELKHLPDFFSALGCAKQQDTRMYVNTLLQINKESESGCHNLQPSSMRHMAVEILNRLKEVKYSPDAKECELFMPIHTPGSPHLTMKLANQCIYDDAYATANMPDDGDTDFFYIHPDVPRATAEALGVQNARQYMLSDTDAFEEWGQQERLTIRIKNLINQCYVDGFSVIKELFQNADDAGASTFRIMYDERQNIDFRTNLISEGMADCQGPAIWVYNDAEFTTDDFINIKRLGFGDKYDDAEKTGRFGLGFCAVYNITDVPSLVSGENLIIFDPHTSFLENALSRKCPGIRIDLSIGKNRNAMMKTFYNQLHPYEDVFGCKIQTQRTKPYFRGTLFRLPLRTHPSEISDIVYTKSEAAQLIDKIKELSSNLLLFNQHTKEVKLYHLPDGDTRPSDAELIFEVHINREQLPRGIGLDECGSIVKKACERKRAKNLGKVRFKQLEEITICTTHVTEGVDYEYNSTVTWLVSWASGIHETCLDIADKNPGMLPLVAVAVPVLKYQKDANTHFQVARLNELPDCFYKSGHYFCFLPISQEHPFKFHINGKFSVSVDRQTLKTISDDDKNTEDAQWNESLMRDAVVVSFISLLEHTTTKEQDRFDLWPKIVHDDDAFSRCFVDSFYSTITGGDMPCRIFRQEGINTDLSKCVFLDPDLRKDKVIGDTALTVLQTLCKEHVIDIPQDVYTLLCRSHPNKLKRATVTPEILLLRYVLPKLDNLTAVVTTTVRDNILKYAVILQNTKVDQWLKGHKCIPSDAFDLKIPAEVVDPASSIARLFPKYKGFFPKDGFADMALNQMKNLGMRCERISDSMVLDIATGIANHGKLGSIPCTFCTWERCLHLMSYICDNMNEHKKIYNQLRKTAFLPVMTKPELWPFQWHADSLNTDLMSSMSDIPCDENHSPLTKNNFIYRTPTELIISEFVALIGCVRFVVDRELCYRLEMEERVPKEKLHKLFSYLGLQVSLDMDQCVDEVVNQMVAMTELVYGAHPNSNILHIVEETVDSVYSYLEKHSLGVNHVQILSSKNIIWISNEFVAPENVSHDDDLPGCQPYLFSSKDTAISRCPNLCRVMHIREHFSAKDVAMALHNIKIDIRNEQLSKKMVKLSVCLLHVLSLCFEREGISDANDFMSDKNDIIVIYAPDAAGNLTDCRQMCYDDSDEIENTESMIYVHRNVPKELATSVGIKSKRLQMLDDTADDVEDFYQTEPLVCRLRRLVDSYRSDTGIFNELLQNADDAGATEIVFIMDYDTYPNENVFDERFRPLQGPALCVYNDSSFTTSDLKGIQKLGRGSKSNDPSKTGTYGVGFNTVYSITDAPSFLTKGHELEKGETLCFFDPLAKFVPNVLAKAPGKRYKDVNYIRETYTDVLKGYHEKYFLDGKVYGTMFRLPLRTEPSEINREVIQLSHLAGYLETFCAELKTAVIFLKYLQKIKVFTHSKGIYTAEYTIEMRLSDTDYQNRCSFSEAKVAMCNLFLADGKSVFHINQRSSDYTMRLTENIKGQQESNTSFYVIQTIGFDKHKPIHKTVMDQFEKGTLGLFPHGGVAVCENEGLAKMNGKAFCFNPLPIDTGLPVHVNGHFALEHETRKMLWKSEHVDNCYKTQWNLTLLRHVIARSYTLLLQAKKSKIMETISNGYVEQQTVRLALQYFHSLFPIHQNAAYFYWKELSNYIYETIAIEQCYLLPYMEREIIANCHLNVAPMNVRLSWTYMCPVDSQYPAYHSDDIGDPTFAFVSTLRSIGMRIVCVPKTIRDSLEQSGHTLDSLAPTRVIQYLCCANIATGIAVTETVFLKAENVITLFQYCLQNKKKFYEELPHLPLILTQDENVRTLQNTGPLFVTQHTDFFHTQMNCFLHKSLVNLVLSVYREESAKHSDNLKLLMWLKPFTINDFMNFVEITDLFRKESSPAIQYTETPTEPFLKSFWEFFKEQLPFYRQDQRILEVSKSLKKLQTLPLIPAIGSSSDSKIAVAVNDSDMLINVDSFQHGTELYELISRFEIVQLDKSRFNETQCSDIGPYELVLEQIPSAQQPYKIMSCFVRNSEKIKNISISISEAEIILRYFSDNVRNTTEKQRRQHKHHLIALKTLPIFATQAGALVALEHFRHIVVVPKSIPHDGLEEISRNTDILLLRDLDIMDLYKHMDIAATSIESVYTEVVLPNQGLFTRAQFYVHIEFICKAVITRDIAEKGQLLKQLNSLPFVDVGNGDCACVRQLFFDQPSTHNSDKPYNFFSTMCKKNEMLPTELQKEHIVGVLKTLGLQCGMNLELFERFANEIEADGKCLITDGLRQRSHLLVEALLNYHCSLHGKHKDSLHKLSKINFVVPIKVDERLTSIHKQFSSTSMICLAKSVLPTKECIHTCWTTLGILPSLVESRGNNTTELLGMLGILKKPSDMDLFRHCKLVFSNLQIKPYQSTIPRELIIEVMRDIYNALDSANQKQLPKALKVMPLIYFPALNTIEKATQVVINCKSNEEIPPYLLKAPTADFGQYQSLFERMGAMNEPTIDSYVDILKHIKHDSGQLHTKSAKEKAAVKSMLNVFLLLRNNKADTPVHISELYLLSETNTLENAHDLVVCDNRYLYERIQGVITLTYMNACICAEELRIDEVIECLKKLDSKCRPRLLSDIVSEVVNTSNIQEQDEDVASEIEGFLHDDVFINSFSRLARHAARNENAEWRDETDLVSAIKRIKMKHVTGIQTYLCLQDFSGNNIQESEVVIERTEEKKMIYFSEEANKTTVYFDTSDSTEWYSDLAESLALHLNECLYGVLKDKLLFVAQRLLQCKDSPWSCENVLDRKRIDAFRNIVNTDASGIVREPLPNNTEGKRWQRQAMSDLADAQSSLSNGKETAYNWVCYRGHQVIYTNILLIVLF